MQIKEKDKRYTLEKLTHNKGLTVLIYKEPSQIDKKMIIH